MSARDNHVKAVHGDMRQILPLHRSTLVDYGIDQEAAKERQGRGPLPKVTKPSKAERQQAISTAEKVAGVLLAVSIGLVGAFALVAWGTQ